ncbi:DNA-binding winged helix-turn-helix (wHTH) domain-containing protein [Pseudoxanthomonas sp. GM95]|uniref:winged helix-turn-helix domain-containing protein n=1 Tax=Pseudoxanthomonas sp. GM95 TaxID=1881043 RepID=UPI0008CE0E26|nr:winged helix-turn-helix domain-containing protein [Pseudoxanthomonas sp. GM95]SEL14754.1 DNA-binding winged helix-turn-helix (wHTH) domain-containing protein [Pseudoxanthomonas sp. GM95]
MGAARYRFGPYLLDTAKRELSKDLEPVALPARVFECLIHLIEHHDRAVDRDELALAVFARQDVSDAQLAQVILRSRRAVGDDGQEQQTIRTVPRYGFRWVAGVALEVVPAPAPQATGLVEASVAAAPAFESADDARLDNAEPEPPVAQAMANPRSPGASRRLITLVAIGAGLAMALVAGVALWRQSLPQTTVANSTPSTPQARAVNPLLVLPVQAGGDDDQAWVRLGLMDDLANRLRQSGLPVVSSDSTLSLLGAALHAGKAEPEQAQLRRQSGAGWIVQGQVEGSSGQWTVHWRAQDAQGLMHHVQASGSNVLSTARLAGDRLLAALGHLPPKHAGDEDPGLAERLQRAQAAMLANEFDTARRVLSEAPELQRAQPLLRYRLATVDFREGRYPQVLASVDALRQDPLTRRDPLFLGRLQLLRGAVLARLGRYPEAESEYEQAIATLQPTGSPNELGDALLGRGNTRMAQHQLDEALEDFGRARVQLLQSGDALAVARVELAVGSIQLLRGLPQQALDYYRHGAQELRQLGALNELASVLNLTQAVDLQLLQPAQALAISDQSWALVPHLHDPALRASMRLARAEALAANGRLHEASAVLADPELAALPPSEARRRAVMSIELTRDQANTASRLQTFDQTLGSWPPDQSAVLRTWQRVHRLGLWRQLGQPAPLADRAAGSGGGLSLALLEAGRQGDPVKADAMYHDALRHAGEQGIPRDLKEAVSGYADWLMLHGRTSQAAGLLGQVMPWADQDFDLSILQARIYGRLGERESWQASLQRAKALAGERAIPSDAITFHPDTL